MSDFMSFSVKIFGTLHVCFQLSFLIQEVFPLFILSSPKSSTFLGLVYQLLWFFSLSLYAFLSPLIFSSANVNPRFGSASMTPPFLHSACRHCPLCFLLLTALTEGLRLQLLHLDLCSFILPPLYSNSTFRQSQVKLLHLKASGLFSNALIFWPLCSKWGYGSNPLPWHFFIGVWGVSDSVIRPVTTFVFSLWTHSLILIYKYLC